MKTRRRGIVGAALTSVSPKVIFANHLSAVTELRDLGQRPYPVSHDHRLNVLRHLTNDLEVSFSLIDYRAGNKVLLIKTMTRLEAWKKNHFLKGTGKAWAIADHSA